MRRDIFWRSGIGCYTSASEGEGNVRDECLWELSQPKGLENTDYFVIKAVEIETARSGSNTMSMSIK